VYAEPAAGANYLFYPEDPASFELALVNGSSTPVSIRLGSEPVTHLTLRLPDSHGGSHAVGRQSWSLSSAGVRIRDHRAPDIPVSAGSAIVLQPDASLVFSVDLEPSAEWPRGVSELTADISIPCEPTCAVKPHANVFRFELRTKLERIDRIEQAYRRALRAFLVKDWDAAERALKALQAEHNDSLMAQYLYGRVAQDRGNTVRAVAYYRAAEATLRARSDVLMPGMSSSAFDDLLGGIQAAIRSLQTRK
jgi:hypothetical protein